MKNKNFWIWIFCVNCLTFVQCKPQERVPTQTCVSGKTYVPEDDCLEDSQKVTEPRSGLSFICCDNDRILLNPASETSPASGTSPATATSPVTPTSGDVSTPFSKSEIMCGRHNTSGLDERVINLKEGNGATVKGEWPHTCVVFEIEEKVGLRPRTGNPGAVSGKFLSGSSLLTPGVILTAAHKIEGIAKEKLFVQCGVWDLKDDKETPQKRLVREVTIHPSFYRQNLYNDYALLHLAEDFVLSSDLDVMCLPKLPGSLTEVDHTICYATGFGQDEAGVPQQTMRQVQVPLVTHEDCQNRLRPHRGQNFILDESFICAGGVGREDTCKGDGGGPLMCAATGSSGLAYIQVGITAWGVKCGTPNVPGVYASIPHGLCFIKWAVGCSEGKKYDNFFTVDKNCEKWIDEEIERLKKRKKELETLATSSKGELERVIQYIKNAEGLSKSCKK